MAQANEGWTTTVTCPNGHDNPVNTLFCRECATQIVAKTVCIHGHLNEDDNRFCGQCSAPVAAPISTPSRTGRWNVDPTARHQYRYWDGETWTEHVVDNGSFESDAVPAPEPRPRTRAEVWLPRAAAIGMTVVSALLVIAAFSTLQSIRKSEPTPATTAEPILAPQTTAPASQAQQPPRQPGQVAVIGASCLPASRTAVTGDKSVAYCEHVQGTEFFVWSLVRGEITYPTSADPSQLTDPPVAVCMEQTGRSPQDCVEYLQRPSDPGDGGR
jgi:uncharacterized protein YlaI